MLRCKTPFFSPRFHPQLTLFFKLNCTGSRAVKPRRADRLLGLTPLPGGVCIRSERKITTDFTSRVFPWLYSYIYIFYLFIYFIFSFFQAGSCLAAHRRKHLKHKPGPNNFIRPVEYVSPIKVTSHKPN